MTLGRAIEAIVLSRQNCRIWNKCNAAKIEFRDGSSWFVADSVDNLVF
jgi:hypothetical protein